MLTATEPAHTTDRETIRQYDCGDSETALFLRWRDAGCQASLAELYDRMIPRLRSFIRKRLRIRVTSDIDEVEAEAWLRAIQKANQFRGPVFYRWLFGIAKFRAKNLFFKREQLSRPRTKQVQVTKCCHEEELRNKLRNEHYSDQLTTDFEAHRLNEVADQRPTAPSESERAEILANTANRLREAIDSLADEHRTIIEYELRGLSVAETAAELGVCEQRIYRHRARALEELRRKLETQDADALLGERLITLALSAGLAIGAEGDRVFAYGPARAWRIAERLFRHKDAVLAALSAA